MSPVWSLCCFVFAGTSIEALFAEELGLVVEVAQSDVQAVLDAYANSGISCVPLGYSMNFFGRNAQVRANQAKCNVCRFYFVWTLEVHGVGIQCVFFSGAGPSSQ